MSKVDLKVWDIKTFIFIIRTSSDVLEIQKDWTGSTESWPKHSELLKFLFPPPKTYQASEIIEQKEKSCLLNTRFHCTQIIVQFLPSHLEN